MSISNGLITCCFLALTLGIALLVFRYKRCLRRTLNIRMTKERSLGLLILIGCVDLFLIRMYINSESSNLADTTELPITSHASFSTVMSKCTGSSISEPPNIVNLQKLGIFEIITDTDKVGTFLLKDVAGNKMDLIRADERTIEGKNRKVFQRWLKGEGRQPTTWTTLIDVLFEVKLIVLAEDIGRKVTRMYCNVSSLPYANSEEIISTIGVLKDKYRSQKVVQFELLEKFNTANLHFFDLILRDHDEHGTSNSDKILHNVLNDATVQKRLLITGPPGSGKTTLVRHIAKKWAEDKSLQTCQILFVIYLDKIRKSKYTSLSNLLKEEYEDIVDIPTVSKEILSKGGSGACFLLDAFDEKYDKTDYVNDLMFNNELPYSICIMTSRPDSDLKAINATVDIRGFNDDNLDSYLQKSTSNEHVKDKVMTIWKDDQIKTLCKLPLHMAMVLFIAQTTHAASIKTKTQIYTAFMNATIKHYKHDHPGWNTVSLRHCVLNHNIPYQDESLCKAFKMMHLAAFKMIFESTFILSVDDTTHEKMESLGFVSIITENSASDEVKITFSHPTFTEFFAALHLITLPQSDQLFHVQNPMIKKKTGLIDFYFGLLGNFYANNVTALSLPLKQYSTAFAYPIRKWEHICPRGYYTAQSSSALRLHQEIGWKGKVYRDLLNSSGIVTHSSVCLSVTNRTITHLHYLLENHGNINKLALVDYSTSLRLVTLSDTINTSHLKLLECFDSFKDNIFNCSRDRYQSSVQQIHIKTNEFSFQTANDLSLAINWLKGFRNMKSFGLSVHNSSLISPPKVIRMLNNLNVSSIEVHCCIEELQTLLMSFPNITTLYLEVLPNCMSHIQGKNLTMLSSALRQPERLQNLILVPTTEINVPVFLTGLTALRYLHIEKMNINGSTATRLIKVASKNLKILDLSHCKLQGWAVMKLSTHLKSLSELQNLVISDASLTDTDVSTLSESIRKLKKLSYLGLSGNTINGEGLQSLVDVLKKMKSFRSLNLFGNPITGHENIIALSQMTNLRTLHISISSNEDKNALMKVIRHLTQLESFRWSLL